MMSFVNIKELRPVFNMILLLNLLSLLVLTRHDVIVYPFKFMSSSCIPFKLERKDFPILGFSLNSNFPPPSKVSLRGLLKIPDLE